MFWLPRTLLSKEKSFEFGQNIFSKKQNRLLNGDGERVNIVITPDKSYYNCLCFRIVYHLPVAVLCVAVFRDGQEFTTKLGMSKSCCPPDHMLVRTFTS